MCGICARLGVNLHETVDAAIGDPHLSLDRFVGDTYRGKTIFNQTQVINQIDSGWTMGSAADGVITFGFFDAKHAVGLYNSPKFGEGAGYTPFTAAQRASARDAITYWDDLIAPSFVEVTGPGASEYGHTDILLANTSTGPAQAWAYYPYDIAQYKKLSSDAWIADPAGNASNLWLDFGGYGDTTLIHELGHSIGLSHPGAYNGAGATTYLNQAEYAQDSKQYSIMSYWSDRETGALVTTWDVFLAGQPQTPLVHDILTVQAIYGADLTTRTGNTTYGFNSNAGRDVFDFNLNPWPFLTVYDAGGNDTIDLSGFTVGQFLDLHAGSFSSIGGAVPTLADVNAQRAQWNADSGAYGPFDVNDPGTYYYLAPITQAAYTTLLTGRVANPLPLDGRLEIIEDRLQTVTGVADINATEFKNFSIAYGTTIENAIGGSARDLLWGNEVANVLNGMGGDDVLNGYEGADDLYGGAGNDTFQFSHLETGDEIYDWNAGDKVDLRASVFGDLTFVGNAAFTNTVGELRYDGGVLSADTNGDGVADFSVVLLGSPAIGAGDLLFI